MSGWSSRKGRALPLSPLPGAETSERALVLKVTLVDLGAGCDWGWKAIFMHGLVMDGSAKATPTPTGAFLFFERGAVFGTRARIVRCFLAAEKKG